MAKESETKPGKEREDYIKQLIAGNYATQPPKVVEPVSEIETELLPIVESEVKREQTKEPKRKRGVTPDYTEAFLKKNEIKTRQCVYISQHVHKVISEIVRVIADKDISVGGYIDTVLLQHLEEHKEEINELYCKDRSNLIR